MKSLLGLIVGVCLCAVALCCHDSRVESQELPSLTFFAPSEVATQPGKVATQEGKVTTLPSVAMPNLAFFACQPGATGLGSEACTVPTLYVYFCPHVVQCQPCLALIDAVTAGDFHDFRLVIEAPSATQLSKWKADDAGRPIIEWDDSSGVRRRLVGFGGVKQFRQTFAATEALVAAGRSKR